MPNRRSRKKEAAFLIALEVHGVVSKAAKAADIPRRTVYVWRDAYEDFRQAWEDALDEALDNLEVLSMQIAAEEQDPQHIRWILSRRRPEKWGDREKVELSGPEGGPIQTEADRPLARPRDMGRDTAESENHKGKAREAEVMTAY